MLAGDLPYVWVSVVDGQASEVGGDPGTLRIERTGPTDAPLTVRWQERGGATLYDGVVLFYTPDNPVDCASPLLTNLHELTIPAGKSFVDVVVTPRTDLLTEGNEVFGLSIVESITAPDSYTFTPFADGEIVIADRPSPQVVTIESPHPNTSENGDDPAYVIVRRSGDLSQRTRVQLSVSGSLQDDINGGVSYAAIFDPGETERLLFVSPPADNLVEDTETLTLSPIPFGPVTIGEQSSVTISCTDGPLSPTVTLTPTADAWVGAGTTEATLNHGSDTLLQVRDSTNGGRREVLMQFDLSSVSSVASANLDLVGQWMGKSGAWGPFTAYGIPGATWTESGVNYNNRPFEPLWSGGSSGINSLVAPGVIESTIVMTSFVQRQKLLGENKITILLTSDSPLFPAPDGSNIAFASRESATPPRLIIEPVSDSTATLFYLSHRALTVPEGGSATAYILARDGAPYNPLDILKIPGGDPDINATSTVIRYSAYDNGETPQPITFTAAPDSDGVNGSATFVVSEWGTPKMITVYESDTGINTPPSDPATMTVPVTAAGFAENGAGTTGGINDTLKVKNTTDDKGEQESFLELDLSALPAADQIGSATLQVYGASGSIAAPGSVATRTAAPPVSVSAYAAKNTDWYWDESSLSWAIRPASTGSAVSSQTVAAQGWYNFDLASLVKSAKAAGQSSISIALKGAVNGTTSAIFDSDEATTNRPRLVVTKKPPATTTVSLRDTADAHVRDGSSAGINYGSATTMEVKKSATVGSSRETYVKFDLSQFSSASQIQSAKLRLYSKLAATGGAVNLSILPVSDTSWTESGIKWSNKPAVGSALGSFSVSSTSAAWKELDVTDYLKQLKQAGKSTAAFAIRATTANGQIVQVTSDEASANRPELRVAKVVPPTTTAKSLRATADTHVRDGAYATQNFGGSTSLEVKKSSLAGSNRQAWLRFDLSGISTISSAKLRLYGQTNSSTGSTAIQLLSSSSTTWGEASLTNANKPAVGSAIGSFSVSGTTSKWYEIDVTSFLKAQKAAGKTAVTFVLNGLNSVDPLATFTSDEAASNRPELRVS